MSTTNESEYLTQEELVERYKGSVTKRTLSNWRSNNEGPKFTKIGGRVLYPLKAVIEWEDKRTRKD